MKAVPKLDEGESDLMVLKQVKITYFDVYISQTMWNHTKQACKARRCETTNHSLTGVTARRCYRIYKFKEKAEEANFSDLTRQRQELCAKHGKKTNKKT